LTYDSGLLAASASLPATNGRSAGNDCCQFRTLLIPSASIPTWDDYAGDFHAGIPLLRSSTVAIDLRPLETIITPLLETWLRSLCLESWQRTAGTFAPYCVLTQICLAKLVVVAACVGVIAEPDACSAKMRTITDLQIDYCEACRGYLKTYSGTGSEGLLLADWTSLHLDIIARDQGLNRYAGSLFQL
jgi:hypothetical protein